MKNIGMVLLTAAFFLGNAYGQRPQDPWVLRAVYNQMPYLILIVLDENLTMIYSSKTCHLYAAWEGVTQDGNQTYRHQSGEHADFWPQGTLLRRKAGEDVWSVTFNGNQLDVDPQFIGYKINGDMVTLHYKLMLSDGSVIQVEEVPEYQDGGGNPGTVREIKFTGIQAGMSVSLWLDGGENDGKRIDVAEDNPSRTEEWNASGTGQVANENNRYTLVQDSDGTTTINGVWR
jgi:hypothetical protein